MLTDIEAEVPQVAAFSTVLFNIYTSDVSLKEISNNANIVQFADDTALGSCSFDENISMKELHQVTDELTQRPLIGSY